VPKVLKDQEAQREPPELKVPKDQKGLKELRERPQELKVM
jgi:hypothetical protein